MSWRSDVNCRDTSFDQRSAGAMKPRFSILALLSITAFVALTFAAMLSPLWSAVWIVAWLVCVAHFVTHATDTSNPVTAACGRTAIVCILLYLVIPVLNNQYSIEYLIAAVVFGRNPSSYIQPQSVLQYALALGFG
ncbi:MAG: hypothetical protein SGJ19_08755 [Planctomycetia bacterium]|nr:hypothetical protein [Planctomycetia bacterium]